MTTTAAIDLGATSGRVILGHWDKGRLDLEEIHRFPNHLQTLHGNDYWNIPVLYTEILNGLRKAVKKYPSLASCGVNTWGVDTALMDQSGRLIFPIHAYRDNRTEPFHRQLVKKDLPKVFQWTGIGAQPFNTSLQLQETFSSYPPLREMVKNILFLPGYFSFLLSGEMANDLSIASTSQLMAIQGTQYSKEALAHFGIPSGVLREAEPAGRLLGTVREAELEKVQVILSPGHDTGCAFSSMPAQAGKKDLYISCGTWSLCGFLSEQPLLSEKALAMGVSNERNGDGAFRPTRILLGLWLLEQTLPDIGGTPANAAEWEVLVGGAEASAPPETLLDISDKRLFNPANMKAAIDEQLRQREAKIPSGRNEYARLILESLAKGQADALRDFSAMTGEAFDRLVLVGGGSKNRLLCQLAANYAGVEAVSYELEGTAVGNSGQQLVSLGAVEDWATFRQSLDTQLKGISYQPAS
ncbi:MAG: rhamnulokinase [Opitutales bacterium]|nr:rhamnulokinase [Opitutales bacterium]MCH8540930.1 rhamnulokinase [Opitutales bacterium]